MGVQNLQMVIVEGEGQFWGCIWGVQL